jgi:hypothetical protein
VHQNFYKPHLTDPIERTGFTPSTQDTDGLSIHRELFIQPQKLAWCGRKPGEYLIIRFRASDLRTEFAVTFVPSPDKTVPGHAVIPELAYTENKKQFEKVKSLARSFAKRSADHIAYRPHGL